MPFLSTATALPNTSPFETARRKLVASLLAMKAPAAYPNYPIPLDHLAVSDHIREAAKIFDEWLSAIGHQVGVNASGEVDQRMFNDMFTAAIEGNATYVVEQVAEQMIEERSSRRVA